MKCEHQFINLNQFEDRDNLHYSLIGCALCGEVRGVSLRGDLIRFDRKKGLWLQIV